MTEASRPTKPAGPGARLRRARTGDDFWLPTHTHYRNLHNLLWEKGSRTTVSPGLLEHGVSPGNDAGRRAEQSALDRKPALIDHCACSPSLPPRMVTRP